MGRTGTSQFKIIVNGRELVDLMHAAVESTVDHRLNEPAEATVTLAGAEVSAVSDAGVRPGASLQVKAVLDGRDTSLFKGKIASMEAEGGPLGQTIIVRAYDGLHAMTRGKRSATYTQVKLSDIMTTVISEYGLSPSVEATAVVHDHVAQVLETDYDFLMRLARQANRVVRVEDGVAHVTKPPETPRSKKPHNVSIEAPDGVATWGDNVLSYSGRVTEAEPISKVEMVGWNSTSQKSIDEGTKVSKGMVSNRHKVPATTTTLVGGPHHEVSAMRERGEQLAESIGSTASELRIVMLGDPSLSAGSTLQFGEVGDPFDGVYIISHVLHRLDAEGYVTDAECTSLANRTLLGSILGGTSPAEESFPGTTVGVVTDINDQEGLGRVKVQLPMLGDEDLITHWARVLHLGAGKDKGLFILPDVGDEVMVTFEHGDVSHPLVLGATFNAKQSPKEPAQTDNEYLQQTWRTPKGQQIALIDEKEREGIKITSHDLTMTVHMDTHNKKLLIESTHAVEVTSKDEVTVSAAKDLTLKGANITLDSKGKITLKGTGKISVNTPADVSLDGTNVKANAKAGLSLKGTASAELSASGITQVKGAILKLN